MTLAGCHDAQDEGDDRQDQADARDQGKNAAVVGAQGEAVLVGDER